MDDIIGKNSWNTYNTPDNGVKNQAELYEDSLAEVLALYERDFVYRALGGEKTIPRNSGNTIITTKLDAIPAGTEEASALNTADSESGNSIDLRWQAIRLQVNPFGYYVAINDSLNEYTYWNVVKEAQKQLTRTMLELQDNIARDTLFTQASVYNAGGATVDDITDTDVFSLTDVLGIVTSLQEHTVLRPDTSLRNTTIEYQDPANYIDHRAPFRGYPDLNETYKVVISPRTINAVLEDDLFVEVMIAGKIWDRQADNFQKPGTTLMFRTVTFIVTLNQPITTTNADGVSIGNALILSAGSGADDVFYRILYGDGMPFQTIIKGASVGGEDTGTEDPLNRKITVGMKMHYGAQVVYPAGVVNYQFAADPMYSPTVPTTDDTSQWLF
jgi:N4-gp56 family major capsid protein